MLPIAALTYVTTNPWDLLPLPARPRGTACDRATLLGRRTFSRMGSEDEHDLVIRNAFIVDGSGAPGYHGAPRYHPLVPLCCATLRRVTDRRVRLRRRDRGA